MSKDGAVVLIAWALWLFFGVSWIHGLVYAATHGSWVWFVINLVFAPIGAIYGIFSWFF